MIANSFSSIFLWVQTKWSSKSIFFLLSIFIFTRKNCKISCADCLKNFLLNRFYLADLKVSLKHDNFKGYTLELAYKELARAKKSFA